MPRCVALFDFMQSMTNNLTSLHKIRRIRRCHTMLDSKLLHTLATVIECKGFEKAAIQLGVTQSAVSQRIKQLEETLGQVLLVRSQPLEVTAAGRRLQQHFRQLSLLEEELMTHLQPPAPVPTPSCLHLACEPDSLASWLLPALMPLMQQQNLHLNISALPQEESEAALTSRLCGWVSNDGSSVYGSQPVLLGHMQYLCVCTPAFQQQYFPAAGSTDFSQVPAVILHGQQERHRRLLLQLAAYDGHFPHSSAPTPQAMLGLISAGLAYGLLPAEFLAQHSHELVCQGTSVQEPLFWHHWRIEPALAKQLGEALLAARQVRAANPARATAENH
ncbi:LysR family transcriptional regulator (chromosome initiation inhibitor) [Vogesella perlucida]|nr:LysR family transcriptional regulator (chromosome initiation inhibitor) [Vogesella perlucida]